MKIETWLFQQHTVSCISMGEVGLKVWTPNPGGKVRLKQKVLKCDDDDVSLPSGSLTIDLA